MEVGEGEPDIAAGVLGIADSDRRRGTSLFRGVGVPLREPLDRLTTMVSSTALLRIREARHALRLAQLEEGIRAVAQAATARSCRVLLFGSLARNDWDGLSDVDLLVIAVRRTDAEALADALVQACLADDVLALDQTTWERRCASSPYWQAIAREARPLLETPP